MAILNELAQWRLTMMHSVFVALVPAPSCLAVYWISGGMLGARAHPVWTVFLISVMVLGLYVLLLNIMNLGDKEVVRVMFLSQSIGLCVGCGFYFATTWGLSALSAPWPHALWCSLLALTVMLCCSTALDLRSKAVIEYMKSKKVSRPKAFALIPAHVLNHAFVLAVSAGCFFATQYMHDLPLIEILLTGITYPCMKLILRLGLLRGLSSGGYDQDSIEDELVQKGQLAYLLELLFGPLGVGAIALMPSWAGFLFSVVANLVLELAFEIFLVARVVYEGEIKAVVVEAFKSLTKKNGEGRGSSGRQSRLSEIPRASMEKLWASMVGIDVAQKLETLCSPIMVGAAVETILIFGQATDKDLSFIRHTFLGWQALALRLAILLLIRVVADTCKAWVVVRYFGHMKPPVGIVEMKAEMLLGSVSMLDSFNKALLALMWLTTV